MSKPFKDTGVNGDFDIGKLEVKNKKVLKSEPE